MMLLLVATFFACALSQSTTGTTYANRSFVPLTVGQRPSQSGAQPTDEGYLAFTEIVSNAGYLYTISRTAALNSANEPPQTLVSHEKKSVVDAGGVTSYSISPDNSWLLFASQLSQPGVWNHYTVSYKGGRITRITPPVFPPALLSTTLSSTNAWNWVRCQCGGSRDIFWGTFATAFQAGATYANEIWSNTRDGDYKRLSVALGQQQVVNAPTKALSFLQDDYDYIFYQANPGPDNSDVATPTQSKAPRNHYMADWNGNNWQISPAATQALGGAGVDNSAGFSFVRSRTCNGAGRYVMIADKVTSATVDSVFIYDVTNRRAAGTTAAAGSLPSAVSPAGAGSCSVKGFSPDESVGIFICAVAPAPTPDTNQELYVVSTSTLAVTKISAAYNAANQAGSAGQINSLSIAGDYVVWTQQVAGPQTALFSYNWKTNTGAATALFTTSATTAYSGGLQYADAEAPANPIPAGFTVRPGGGAITLQQVSSTAYAWFLVSDIPLTKTQYFNVAVAGAAGSAKVVADTIGTAGSLQARSCINPPTDPCLLSTSTCQSCGCRTRACGGWPTWLATPTGGNTPQVFSAKFDGTNVAQTAITPTTCAVAGTPNPLVIWTRVTNHPFTNPLRPLVYFTATTGAVGSEVQNLYVVQAGNSSASIIAPTSPIVAKGGVFPGTAQICDAVPAPTDLTGPQTSPRLSPDNKWILFQAQTSSTTVAETYLIIADNSAAARKVSPAPDATHTSAAVPGAPTSLYWSRDSKYALFVHKDITPAPLPVTRRRDQLWSVQADASATPLVYNLTVQSPLTVQTDLNPIADMTSIAFHCNQRTLIYQTAFPESGSPSQIYSVPVTGGKTTLLSFDPARGVPATLSTILRSQFAVVFTGNYFDAGGNADIFWNIASQSMLTPALAVLAVLLALFVQ